MGFAAIARVTEDRWIACSVKSTTIAFGLRPAASSSSRPRSATKSAQHRQPVVIDDVARDAQYASARRPRRSTGFRATSRCPSCCPSGEFFGTLCAIDPRPARVNTPEIVGTFKLFAELIAFHLDANRRLAASEAALLERTRNRAPARTVHRRAGTRPAQPARQHFERGTRARQGSPLPDPAKKMVDIMQKSVRRMAGSHRRRARFRARPHGRGHHVDAEADEALTPVLEQVVAELRMNFPDRVIETDFTADGLREVRSRAHLAIAVEPRGERPHLQHAGHAGARHHATSPTACSSSR